MTDYRAINSFNLSGADLGLNWIPRISTMVMKNAQPIDWHQHSALEIVCCAKGRVDYEFASGRQAKLRRGEFIVIPPRLRHRLIYGLDRPSTRFSIFLSARANAADLQPLLTPAAYRSLVRTLREKSLTPLCAARELLPLVLSLPDEIIAGTTKDPANGFRLKANLLAVIASVVHGTDIVADRDETAIIDEAIAYLRQNLNRRASIDKLIRHIGYGRSRFYELFRSRTGFSPLEWLTRLRVEHARDLLDHHATPTVAMCESGFHDVDFFRTVFRRLVGVTPAEYFRNRKPTASAQE